MQLISLLNEKKYVFIINLIVCILIFGIFFFKNFLQAILSASGFYVFAFLPGYIWSLILFEKRPDLEQVIFAYALPLIFIGFGMYIIGIFEFIHAKYTSFAVPAILLIIGLIVLNRNLGKKQ